MRTLLFEGSPLIIGKARAESRVHRRALMDDITMRRCSAQWRGGRPSIASSACSPPRPTPKRRSIFPVLRAKLAEVLEAERAQPGSHDYKESVAAFNSFPKEELFRARVAELRAQMRLVIEVKNARTTCG